MATKFDIQEVEHSIPMDVGDLDAYSQKEYARRAMVIQAQAVIRGGKAPKSKADWIARLTLTPPKSKIERVLELKLTKAELLEAAKLVK